MRNDIKNEADFIPEGLEFKQEYMVNAFELYEKTLKRKKRRKIFIFLFLFTLISINLFFYLNFSRLRFKEISLKSSFALNSLENEKKSFIKTYAYKKDSKLNQILKNNVSIIKHKNNLKVKKSENKSINRKLLEKENFKLNSDLRYFSLVNENSEVNNVDNSMEIISSLIYKTNFNLFNFQNNIENCYLESLENQEKIVCDQFKFIKKEYAKNSIYFGIGFNSIFSLENNQKPFSMKESINVGYSHNFKNRWKLNSNFEYYITKRVNLLDSTDVQNYTFKTPLTYLVLSTGLTYQLNSKNEFSCNFGVDHSIKNYISFLRTQNENDNLEAYNNMYIEKLRKNNYFISFGYKYAISSITSLNLNYKFGFNDAIKDFSNSNYFDRNSRLQLILEFKLKRW